MPDVNNFCYKIDKRTREQENYNITILMLGIDPFASFLGKKNIFSWNFALKSMNNAGNNPLQQFVRVC